MCRESNGNPSVSQSISGDAQIFAPNVKERRKEDGMEHTWATNFALNIEHILALAIHAAFIVSINFFHAHEWTYSPGNTIGFAVVAAGHGCVFGSALSSQPVTVDSAGTLSLLKVSLA